MAKELNSPTGFDLVVERVQNKFPHFLLGVSLLIVAVIAISLIVRDRTSQQVSDLTPTQVTPMMADATATPAMKKSIGSKIAEFFMPKKEETEQPKAQSRTYIVKAGDGLWGIADAAYKDGTKWSLIAEANSLTAPYVLEIGQKLVLPDSEVTQPQPTVSTVTPVVSQSVGETTPEAAFKDNSAPVTGPSYVVSEGECLWTIAQEAYGDGFMYKKIAEANNIANPDLIYPGQRFVLPRN